MFKVETLIISKQVYETTLPLSIESKALGTFQNLIRFYVFIEHQLGNFMKTAALSIFLENEENPLSEQ